MTHSCILLVVLGEMKAEGRQQVHEARGEERRQQQTFLKKNEAVSHITGDASPEEDTGNSTCHSLLSEGHSPWIEPQPVAL